MLKQNAIPHQLSELFDTVGVRFLDEWSQESVSMVLILFRVIKAKETHGKWFISDIHDLVAFICETENKQVEVRPGKIVDYKKILTEMRPCSLEDIPEFWQVQHLAKHEREIYKGAKRFYRKLSSLVSGDPDRSFIEAKLIEILSRAEQRYQEHNDIQLAQKLILSKAMASIYFKYKNIANRLQVQDTSVSHNKDRKNIGLGMQSVYKRNNLAKEVLVDLNTSPKSSPRSHHLYTAGWSADGHFIDEKE